MTLPYFIATGMFRSGTTFLGKILNAHPEVSLASDPFRSFFNDLRDTLAEQEGVLGHAPHAPLGAYFADPSELKLFRSIQDTDLSVKISPERLAKLLHIISSRRNDDGLPFAPFIMEKISKVQGRTYREVYDSMMALVHECYGKKGAKVVGTKEVWCAEFTGALLRSFPDMKVLQIIRDPRAVCASNHRKRERSKYPWLFLIRQWRKLAILTWYYSAVSKFKSSVLAFRYEDLVADPESVTRRIASHLGVNYSTDMIDPSKYRDGLNKPWTQNSSHGTSEAISGQFMEKWKEILSDEEVRHIEMLCYPEMKLFGYEPVHSDAEQMTSRDILNAPIVPFEELADWIRPFSSSDRITNISEMAKEQVRKQLVALPDKEATRLDPGLIEAFYLKREHFDNIRKDPPVQPRLAVSRPALSL